MAATLIIAGDALSGLTQTAGNDGTLIVQAGPAGAKLNAIALAADGTPTFLKVPAVTAVQSMVRLNTANGYGSTNTVIRRFTIIVTNQGSDITYTDSATLGATFTINTAGVYTISYNDQFNAANDMGISLNSSQLTTPITSITNSDILSVTSSIASARAGFASFTGYLVAGSVVRAHTALGVTGTSVNLCQFTITRVA